MFLISVVIPVYNTEQYVTETIDSVINQSIGFEQNIEMILINNGSVDSSGEICQKYVTIYPNNTVYLEKNENKGVSSSRNQGMTIARGKYITFLDSDDLWSKDAFLNAVNMLEEYADEIDVVSSDMTLFESISKDHVNNQNHMENVIIDMHETPQLIRTNGPATIIKTEIAKKYLYDTQMTCWEDTRFLNEILLEKEKYGMLSSDNRYFYRIRSAGTSASQTKYKKEDYFDGQLHMFCDELIEKSQDKYGRVTAYLQYLLAYAIMSRIYDYCQVLDENDIHRFEKYSKEIFQYIDEKCIWEVGDFEDYVRIKAYAMKKGLNIDYFTKKEKQQKLLENRIGKFKNNNKLISQLERLRTEKVDIKECLGNFTSVVIYGMALPGIVLFNLLLEQGYNVVCGIDRRADKIEYNRINIIFPDENVPHADVMIVMVPSEYEGIKEKYQDTFDGDIISIEAICK